MSLMLNIRKVGDYRSVEVVSGNTNINLGLLDDAERKSLVYHLRSALRQLSPENEDLECQIATATDVLDTWARQEGVEQCDDPYKNYGLRNLVYRLWDRINDKADER